MNKLNSVLRLFIILIMSMWLKSTQSQSLGNSWTYIEIDSTKSKWGDFDVPKWLKYLGMDLGDLNGDGLKDVLSGRSVYINPGSDLNAAWAKVDLGLNVDGILIMDVDGDEFGDVIAQALPNVYWLEATNKEATAWRAIKIGEIPPTSHINSQGFAKGQIIAGGREEFVIASEKNIYCFEIPETPTKRDWKVTLVTQNTSDEGLGLGDIDGDGDIDIAAGRRPEGGKDPLIITWHENPGNGTGNWKGYAIGKTNHPIDRVSVADMNGDGKADIVVTEERHPGKEPDGNIFWFQQPKLQTEKWTRNWIATQYSTNSLDIMDMDGDRDLDIIVGEHKNKYELQVWKNNGLGTFTKEILDTGKESHLGTKVEDMDGDGDLDIVSIGWGRYQYVHLWRNDERIKPRLKYNLISSSNGDMETPNDGSQQTAALVFDVDLDGQDDFVIAERTSAPAIVWYKYNGTTFDKKVIHNEHLRIEAGGTYADIDKDGDLDVVFGGDARSNEIWWWENPNPKFDHPWIKRVIKNYGEMKHHDQIFGDFDNDKDMELVSWNQRSSSLYMFEIPKSPKKTTSVWENKVIYKRTTHGRDEGLAQADINLDGKMDIIGAGKWFEQKGDGSFDTHFIDEEMHDTRSAVGQLIKGGSFEVIISPGDGVGNIKWYEFKNGEWIPHILDYVIHGHTIDVKDMNGDGNMDIFIGEMGDPGDGQNADIFIFYGNGEGGFKKEIIRTGQGIHEGRIGDFNGDGMYDILVKPYHHNAPKIEVMMGIK